jgi:DNA-binding SARP family transcriptional activator
VARKLESRRASIPDDVFQSLPYGIVVVDGDGAVAGWNDAAERMLPDLSGGEGPRRCEELFACGGADGPCRDGCLAARAAQGGQPLPEIRIDTQRPGGASALWVTAAPLARESRAVLHLRPGDARDRRRRTEPHWVSGPELRIRAFGRIRIDSAEGPLGGQWLHQRPGQVLKYLICERNRVVYAEEIADAIWPGTGRQGLNNVRHYVHGLRDRLEPSRAKRAPSSFVVAVRGGYAINRRHVRIDADEFEDGVQRGLRALEAGDREEAGERLTAALELYTGEFLADEPYAEWVYEERNRLRGLATRALRALTKLAVARRDLDEAATRLERLAELEPYDADVHRDLYTVWLALGRRTETARAYTAYRMRMLREFSEEPGFELADLRPGQGARLRSA